MFDKLISIGVVENQPKYLQNRIRIANITCIVGAPMSMVYFAFYALYFPPVLPAILTAFIVILSTFLFNYLRQHYIARFLLSVITPLFVSVIHGYAVMSDSPPAYPLMVFMFALTLLPWLMIDIREFIFLFLMVVLNFSILLNQQFFIDTFETDYPTTLFEQDFFILFLIVSALLLAAMLLFILNYRTLLSEKENEKLVNNLSLQNEALAEQQATLQEQLNAIQIQQQEAKIRAWQSTELQQLNQILRGTLSKKEILQGYLSGLVRAIEAQQGAIYVLPHYEESEEAVLTLEAAHALSLDKIKTTKFSLGEGLVGQCAIDKKNLYLDEIPAGQFKIESGLGESTPSSAIYLPLIFQDNLEGVLEVLSLHKFALHQKELLEQACVNLAAWLFNQHSVQYIQNLLNIAQSQAELLAQNEEVMMKEFELLELKNKELMQQLEQYSKKQPTESEKE